MLSSVFPERAVQHRCRGARDSASQLALSGARCISPHAPPEPNRLALANTHGANHGIDGHRKTLLAILLVAASCGAVLAQNQSINELRRMFEYDQNAPLDVKELGVINRKGVQIHDITYASPKSGRVTAYLVDENSLLNLAAFVVVMALRRERECIVHLAVWLSRRA